MPSAEKCAHAQSRQVSFHLNQIGRKNHVCSDFAQTEVNKELLIKPPCLVCLVFFQWNEWRRRRKQAHVKVTCTSFVSFPLSCKGSLSAASEFTENLLKFVSSVVNGCEQSCGVKALHFFFRRRWNILDKRWQVKKIMFVRAFLMKVAMLFSFLQSGWRMSCPRRYSGWLESGRR